MDTLKSAGRKTLNQIPVTTGKNYLLAIAIDEYDHCPRLHNCMKDAQALIDLLQEKYRFEATHITTLFNEEATRRNILNAFKELQLQVKKPDNLLVYFSGHGEYQGEVGYWIPVEAEPGEDYGYISTYDITSRLDLIDSFHTFLIVDACFSGSLFVTYKNIQRTDASKPSRWGLAASHSKEVAIDGTPGDNSPFAERLLFRLKHNTGELSVQELSNFVVSEVQRLTRGRQTPVSRPLNVKGDELGQYIFDLKKDEQRDWVLAQQEHSPEAYRRFLAAYPSGQLAVEAQQRLQQLETEQAWAIAQQRHTIGSYNTFLEHFSNSTFAQEALSAIAQLEEEQVWQRATRRNTVSEYRSYIINYPSGKHITEAEQRIAGILKPEVPATPALKRKPTPKPKKEPAKKTTPEPQKKSTPSPVASTSSRWSSVKSGISFLFLIAIIWGIRYITKRPEVIQDLSTVTQSRGEQEKVKGVPYSLDNLKLALLPPDDAAAIPNFMQNVAKWHTAGRLDNRLVKSLLGYNYIILGENEGTKPQAGKEVAVNYAGALKDGTIVGNSFDTQTPFRFTIGEKKALQGFELGVPLLATGSKALFFFPPELGYGANGGRNIPPNSELIFYVERVE